MILLDTCSLLWLVSDQSKLSKTASELIARSVGNIFVSSISAFEVGLKYHKGLLKLPLKPEVWFHKALTLHGLEELTVTSNIAISATALSPINSDPADRIIIATAATHKLKIVSPDVHMPKYEEVQVVW